MGRPGTSEKGPRSRDCRISREDALLLALVLLERDGAAGANVAQIAARIGCARSWLYSNPAFCAAVARARIAAEQGGRTANTATPIL